MKLQAKTDVEHIVVEFDSLAPAIGQQSQALAGVESMVRKLDAVSAERNRLSGQTERLSAGLAETNKVVATIASKTNLLAMNAADEAASVESASAIRTISDMPVHVQPVIELERQAQSSGKSRRESGVVSSLQSMRTVEEVVQQGSENARRAVDNLLRFKTD